MKQNFQKIERILLRLSESTTSSLMIIVKKKTHKKPTFKYKNLFLLEKRITLRVNVKMNVPYVEVILCTS